jgi:hypothetical protein
MEKREQITLAVSSGAGRRKKPSNNNNQITSHVYHREHNCNVARRYFHFVSFFALLHTYTRLFEKHQSMVQRMTLNCAGSEEVLHVLFFGCDAGPALRQGTLPPRLPLWPNRRPGEASIEWPPSREEDVDFFESCKEVRAVIFSSNWLSTKKTLPTVSVDK